MNTEEQREKMKMMRKHLGVIYDFALELKKDKVLTDIEFTNNFEYMIRAMEDCIDTASERIECIHSSIEIVSMNDHYGCLLYTSPSPRDLSTSRMPSSA